MINLSKFITNLRRSMKKPNTYTAVKSSRFCYGYRCFKYPFPHPQSDIFNITVNKYNLHWFHKHSSHATEGNGLWIGPPHCYYWWMDLMPCFQEIQNTKRFADIYGYFWRLSSRFINSKLRTETSNCVSSLNHEHME